MATYQYEAMNAQGQEVKDEIDALSTEEAISKIRNMGYFPTKIKEKGARKGGGKKGAAPSPGAKAKRKPGSWRKVKVKKLCQFTRQLSTLQDAGLPILRSLRILEQQQKGGTLKHVCRSVADDVESGSTLSEAMAKYPKAFNRLYTNMVAAGEAGGVLDLILHRLAEVMVKGEQLKAKIKGPMLSPIAVLTIAFAIVFGIMTIVVPKFKTIFADMDMELPAVTQALLDFSDWLIKKWGIVWILGTIPAIILLTRIIRLHQMGRFILDTITLKVPIMGAIVGKSSIARFARTLGTLISAGVPILDALTITRDTTGNEVYRKALNSVHDNIRRGETFAEPLRKARVCDVLVSNMIDVGEETGELDKMLIKVADTYDEEVDVLVAGLVALMEPILVIFLGGICGFIVIALFMPMVKMISSFGG